MNCPTDVLETKHESYTEVI